MNLNLLNKLIFGGLFVNSISGALDCKNLVKDGFKFNLEEIQSVLYNKNVTSPPTTNEIAFRINLCEPLKIVDNVPKEDQCSDKAFGCKIVTNFKGEEKPRIISVMEIAKSTDKQAEPKWEVTKNALIWTMDNQQEGDKNFKVRITLAYDKNSVEKKPTLNSGENDRNIELTLRNKYISAAKDDSNPNPNPNPEKPNPPPKDPPKEGNPDDDNKKSSGSGFTTFLIIVFVFLGFYFIGGCVYNYHFYDARGLNLVPHLSFWREVPEMTMQLIRRGVLLISGRRRGRYTRV
ncbi:hypothetical protein CONCODRAFT_78425 [Conidiobolus coronatus NRRL 28638]|uniref:Uncharacterized protein n=1 Tax=Conidiobolus coronatus (strain ATCC 28846 / CBS 209.66 / NRRL 28638) TaxID=796925 RepID=A0A137P8F7_CONC2|nr:hypothetical protein CONCODRAFT_78425 [Conidiobolus coronatus NRRL 28638]|eukprot:KXN71288.1 hypothetical protein CONCODRAFT_78425 [Conidiobolus coronatus NRRL 28638]